MLAAKETLYKANSALWASGLHSAWALGLENSMGISKGTLIAVKALQSSLQQE